MATKKLPNGYCSTCCRGRASLVHPDAGHVSLTLTCSHSRRAALALGNFPLNVSFATAPAHQLGDYLSSLVPLFQTLSLSIPRLNDPAEAFFQPRSVSENLEAGQLQLPAGTNLLVDETQMKEGTLGDKGVRNVRALSTVITEQKLDYVFPFTEFAFPTDLPVLVVSQGKTFLPVPCIVHVQPVAPSPSTTAPTAQQLARWRSLLQRQKHADFAIPEPMIKVRVHWRFGRAILILSCAAHRGRLCQGPSSLGNLFAGGPVAEDDGGPPNGP
jgi:hypothetical protein